MKNLKKITLYLLVSIAAHESIMAKAAASTSKTRVHMPHSLQEKLKKQADLLDQLRSVSTSNLHKGNIDLAIKIAKEELGLETEGERVFRSAAYWDRQTKVIDAIIARLTKLMKQVSSEANPNMIIIHKELKAEILALKKPSELRNQTLDS